MRISTPLLLSLVNSALVSAVEYCNQNSTTSGPGECLSASACQSSGGTLTTTGCSCSDTTLGCCTWGTCMSGSGFCQPKSLCGGVSTAGLCPGPADIQCCTSGDGLCAALGGTCKSTSTCSASNGLSVAGYCPGAADVQCCTPYVVNCGYSQSSAPTLGFIMKWEGFVASPAPDPIGLPTVGYGHLCQQTNCTEITYKFPLSQVDAINLLKSDLHTYEKCLSGFLNDTVILNDNQYGALISWTYNEGCTQVGSSTLVRRMNAGENITTVASEELPKWVYAGGQILEGLVNRRNAEVALFQTASSITAHPPAC